MPYPYSLEIPALVERAHARARAIGFPLMPAGRPIGEPAPTTATIPVDGALLRCLAAGRPGSLIGEIGTGPGVSTAWLVCGMTEGARLITCEQDPILADGAAAFFSDYPSVTVRTGDWRQALADTGPFDLLFLDADARSTLSTAEGADQILDLVNIGGQIVMDDLTPVEMWPIEWRGMTDYKREFALAHPCLVGVEVRTSAHTVCLVASRVR